MSSQILFRSHKTSQNKFGNSQNYIKQHGSSWSHLRLYTPSDDIRNIAWNKIKVEGLSVRERENNGEFSIISYWGESIYDDFFIQNPYHSKKYAIEKYRTLLTKSAKGGGYPYKEYIGSNTFGEIIKKQPKNHLILVCNIGAITPDIELLAFHNDLIYIDIYHPFEKNPDDSILFSGKIIDLDRYKKAYAKEIENKKNTIQKLQGSYISLSTEDDFVMILNTFFKKRYALNG